MAQEINSQNFEALIASGQPVVVDFWATWCGPCQMVGPFIEELAHEYEGRVIVGKCDVDQDSDLPGQFNVRNIPTILFFKGGQLAKKLVGAQSKEVLKAAIEELL
ncbi:MAG: thioredoxin [Porphyromonadaceae bacterium]|nr:thioredoxin [Porphyromonadaceae bacterium]